MPSSPFATQECTAIQKPDVLEAVHRVAHTWRAQMRRNMQHAVPQLSFGEVRMLMAVGRTPGITPKALAQQAGADRAQITRVLDRLDHQGWLQRMPHPQDGRSHCLQLTAQGANLFDRLQQERQALSAQILSNLSAEKAQQLKGLLWDLQQAMEALGNAQLFEKSELHP